MTAKVSAFLDEIRSHPTFIAGVAADPNLQERFDAGVLALQRLYERGNDDPQAIEVFDRITGAVRAGDGGMKARLDTLLKVLIDIRRGLKIL
jgi:hypothetical protein